MHFLCLGLYFSNGFLINAIEKICWHRLLVSPKLDLVYITILHNILSPFSYIIGIDRYVSYFMWRNVVVVLLIVVVSQSLFALIKEFFVHYYSYYILFSLFSTYFFEISFCKCLNISIYNQDHNVHFKLFSKAKIILLLHMLLGRLHLTSIHIFDIFDV